MISYINKTDFFTLLGLDELSENDKSQYEDEVLSTLVNSVFARILEDTTISQDRRTMLKEFLARTDITTESFDSMMEQFPESDKYIDQEIYLLKKDMIREMIVDVLETPGVTEDEKSQLNSFNEILDSDQNVPDSTISEAMNLILKYS